MANKHCFVSVGATASFHELLAAVLRPDFISALKAKDYTDLVIQYGKGGREQYTQSLAAAGTAAIKVSGFDLDRNGLTKYMREASGSTSGTTQGVVISHAGSGTILDALRLGAPLIVVPNASLLDNHQVELAEALAEQGYVVHGQLNSLSQALTDVEALAKQHKEWPPVNSGKHRESKGLKGVLDEEMGFLD